MLAEARLRSTVMLPDDVIGEEPMESVELVEERPTDVTVPAFEVRHVPFTATQPPYGRFTPARVDVAVVEADVADNLPVNVVVPELVNWVRPEKVLLSARSVEEAAPESEVRYPASLVHCEILAVVKSPGESF
jgi:hypothetical protein